MGKGGIQTKSKAPSVHSRAARRAASPSIDIDKSLKNARPPPESVNERPAVLAAHRDAGVLKKTRKQGRKSILSSKMRKRHEKSMERAESAAERVAVRIAKSKGQAKVLHTRRKPWEEVNNIFLALDDEGGKKKKKTDPERGAEDAALAAFYAETDEEMDEDGAEDGQTGDVAGADVPVSGVPVQPASIPLPAPPDDEEEIL